MTVPEEGSRRVLLPVALAAFITGLDNTIVTVAAPVIGRELNLSFTRLEWVATAYILSFSSLMLVGGRLTDRFGRRRILQVGLAIFMVSSIFAATAPGGDMLIAARAAQGIGGALVLPATFAVIATDLTGRARHFGSGVLMAAIATSLALGPVVGGLFSQHWDWRWIFWINLPLVGGTMYLITRTMKSTAIVIEGADGLPLAEGSRRARRLEDPRARRAAAWRGLDTPGLALATIALVSITYVLVQGQSHGFGSARVLTMIALAVVGLTGFVVVEALGSAPLIDVSLFRNRVVAGGTVVQMLWGLGINGVFFFTSIYLQDVLGFSPSLAGVCFVPLAVALVLAVPVAAWLATRFGPHTTVALGMFMMAGGLVQAGFIGRDASIWDLLPSLVVLGSGSALTTPLTSAIFEAVPERQAGVASALVSTFREMSGVLGIAVTGAVLVAREAAALADGAGRLDAFTSGYHTSLFVAAGLVATGGVVAYVTLRVPGASHGSDEARDQDSWSEDTWDDSRAEDSRVEPADAEGVDAEGAEGAYVESGYDQTVYAEGVYAGFEYDEHVYAEPEYESVYAESRSAESGHDAPVHAEMGYASTVHGAFEYAQLAYHGPVHETARRPGRRVAEPRTPARHGDWVATSERGSRPGRHADPVGDVHRVEEPDTGLRR